MIEFKSEAYKVCLTTWIILTLLLQPYTFFITGNYLTLVSPIIALVVLYLMNRKRRFLIAWVRGWSIWEASSGVLTLIYVVTSFIEALLDSKIQISVYSQLILGFGGILGILVGGAFYFQTPKYVVLKDKFVHEPMILPEDFAEYANKLKMKDR